MLPGQTWTSYTGLWSSIMGPVGDAEFVTNYETYMRYDGRSKAKTVQQLIDKSKDLADTILLSILLESKATRRT